MLTHDILRLTSVLRSRFRRPFLGSRQALAKKGLAPLLRQWRAMASEAMEALIPTTSPSLAEMRAPSQARALARSAHGALRVFVRSFAHMS